MTTTIQHFDISIELTHTCDVWPSIQEAFIRLEDLDLFMLEVSKHYPLIDAKFFAPKGSKTNGTWYADVADIIDACGSYVNSERVRIPALYDCVAEKISAVEMSSEYDY